MTITKSSLLLLGGFLSICPSFAMWDTSDPPRFAGDVLRIAIPLTGAGVALAQNDTEGLKQWGYTVGTTALSTQALKYSFKHTPLGLRPDGSDRLSMPSGHTSSACSGAAFIGQRYGWKYGSAAMVPAAYVGWSRIYAKKHHPRDVAVGCLIGVAAGLALTDPKDTSQITPWYENQTLDLSVYSVW